MLFNNQGIMIAELFYIDCKASEASIASLGVDSGIRLTVERSLLFYFVFIDALKLARVFTSPFVVKSHDQFISV